MITKRFQLSLGLATAAVALLALGFFLRPVSYFRDYQYAHEWITGTESRFIDVAGIRVHYIAQGPAQGRTIVLVHGLAGSAEDWSKIAPYLVNAGYRVYMIDLPGYGRSEWPRNFSYSVQDEATVVVEFFDAMKLRQTDLVGWSMGGWIVQLVAAEHPDRVLRLVIFDSVGLNVPPDWDTRLFTPQNTQQVEELNALLMIHPPKIPGFIIQDILRVSAQQEWVIRRALASMLSGKDVTDALLPAFKMPVLLIWGTEDRITPLSLGQKMHQLIPKSELDVFPGCDHMAPRDCGDEIAPKIVGFLTR